MSDQMTFKRYEIKFLLSTTQYRLLMTELQKYMIPDIHGHSTIRSLYLDTPDWILARRSLDGPVYKEKMRLRSYVQADADTTIFVELKKKYEGIVYKRRIHMSENDAVRFCCTKERRDAISQKYMDEYTATDRQIVSEMAYAADLYKNLRPAVLLTYERDAWYGKDDHEFRITFDQEILWRDTDVNLHSLVGGEPLLQNGQVLMEVKCAGAIPLWLVDFLTMHHIFKTSFSKYGNAFRRICLREAAKEKQLYFAPRRRYAAAAGGR